MAIQSSRNPFCIKFIIQILFKNLDILSPLSYQKNMTQTWLIDRSCSNLSQKHYGLHQSHVMCCNWINIFCYGWYTSCLHWFLPLRLSCSFLILLTNQYFWVASYLHKYVMRTIHWKSHQSDTFPLCLLIVVMWLYLTMSRWQKDVQTIVIIERT